MIGGWWGKDIGFGWDGRGGSLFYLEFYYLDFGKGFRYDFECIVMLLEGFKKGYDML